MRAATRLLYYFPKEAAQLISDRLAALDVSRTGPPSSQPASRAELEALIKRENKNAVPTVAFIRAVAWCREPAVFAALRSICDRTADEDILQAISPSLGRR